MTIPDLMNTLILNPNINAPNANIEAQTMAPIAQNTTNCTNATNGNDIIIITLEIFFIILPPASWVTLITFIP